MITIVPGKGNGCGLCARICHEYCIKVSEKSVAIDRSLCSSCGQCVAICPTLGLAWDGAAPVPFDATRFPSAEQVAELLGERRTVRQFRPDKIDRLLLEEILGVAALAPTRNFCFRTIAVDDDALLEAMDASVLRFSRKIYYWVFRNPVVGLLAGLSSRTMKNEFVKARPKFENSLTLGKAYKSRPPAIILIIGHKRTLSRSRALSMRSTISTSTR